MTYYKIIQGGEAVDAAFTFLRWDERHGRLMGCEPRDAQYVQSMDGETVYRVGWLNPTPDGAPVFETCECVIIDAQEYDDLKAALDSGETVQEPQEPQDGPQEGQAENPAEEPQEAAERPMTVQEMREKIMELVAGQTSMTAKENYAPGSYFVLHDVVYRATDPIVKGSEIKPGYNCEQKTLDDIINQ